MISLKHKYEVIEENVRLRSELTYYVKECDRLNVVVLNRERQFFELPAFDTWARRIKKVNTKVQMMTNFRNEYRKRYKECMELIEVQEHTIRTLTADAEKRIAMSGEISIRSFVTAYWLSKEDKINYHELAVLATGRKSETFKLSDISKLFRLYRFFKVEVRHQLAEGNIKMVRIRKNVDGKCRFFITDKGKERLEEVVKIINGYSKI